MTPGTDEPKGILQIYTRTRRGSVVIGDLLYAKGGSVGPRTQMDYQLVVIHRGSLSLKLDDTVIDVPEDHGILLSPGHVEHFLFAKDQKTHHSWIAVAPEALSPELRHEFLALRGPIPFLGRMAALMDTVRMNCVPCHGAESLHNGFYEGLAVSVLCDFAAAVSEGCSNATAGDKVLLQMDRFLTEAFARSLTLNDIARSAGVSRQYLLRLCRIAGRPTPMKQLYSKRVEIAADLLLHTGLCVAEIAEQCGFADQFHFSRKFKESLGRSPQAWRTSLWRRKPVQILGSRR